MSLYLSLRIASGRSLKKSVTLVNNCTGAFGAPLGDVAKNFHTTLQSKDIFAVQDEQDFKQKVIQSSKPVVVEFHASWCGPCKQLMPRLENIVGAMPNEPVDLAKVDIDDLPEIAMEYGVGAVPSVLLMSKGKVLDKFVGLQEEDKIKKFVSSALK